MPTIILSSQGLRRASQITSIFDTAANAGLLYAATGECEAIAPPSPGRVFALHPASQREIGQVDTPLIALGPGSNSPIVVIVVFANLSVSIDGRDRPLEARAEAAVHRGFAPSLCSLLQARFQEVFDAWLPEP